MKLLAGGLLFTTLTYVGIFSDRPNRSDNISGSDKVRVERASKRASKLDNSQEQWEDAAYYYDGTVQNNSAMMFFY